MSFLSDGDTATALQRRLREDPELALDILKDLPCPEMVARARRWWDKTGRKLMTKPEVRRFFLEEKKRLSPRGTPGPLVIIKDEELDLPQSGLVAGAMFDYCSLQERRRIVRHWALNHYIAPQMPQPAPRKKGQTHVRKAAPRGRRIGPGTGSPLRRS